MAVVSSGYGASKDLYNATRRINDVPHSVDGGVPLAVQLKDTMKLQSGRSTP